MNGMLFGIVGPTACRKTEVSIAVAQATGAEIVSTDSVQVYRGMDIGSAKPDLSERAGIPHHMLDVAEIDAPSYSVAAYRDAAFACIDGIIERRHTPLLVGGSGLYVSALTQPLNFAIPSDPEIRAETDSMYERSPQEAMEKLMRCDPQSAARLHIHDKKRIVRALEVYRCAGKPLSSYSDGFTEAQAAPPRYPSRLFGLTMERSALYARINTRVDRMLENGLLDEARTIYARGFDRSLPAMQSIGYRQLFEYFDGACTLEEAIERIKMETRRYAKRQYTWFNRYRALTWLSVDDGAETAANRIIEAIREEQESC